MWHKIEDSNPPDHGQYVVAIKQIKNGAIWNDTAWFVYYDKEEVWILGDYELRHFVPDKQLKLLAWYEVPEYKEEWVE